MMYRKRIEKIRKAIKHSTKDNKERQLEIIQSMIDQSITYVEAVVNMESRMEAMSFRLEIDEYQQAIEQLDKRRRAAHDSLISKISIVNRICVELTQEKIYQGEPCRESIAAYAFDLVKEYKPEKLTRG